MLPLIFTLLLLSSACQPSERIQETVQTDDSPPDSPEVISVEGEVVFGPGDLIFPDTKAGLADLSSYKATLTLSFDGTRDGETQQWTKTYVMLTTREPAVRQLTIDKNGDLSDIEAVFMAELDGAAYERLGENSCIATVIDQENTLGESLEPAGFLTGVHGAEAAGADTVSGAAADHYTFDERAFGQLDIAQSTGEIWVASEGGYIVKYVLTTIGNADYFGEGVEGILTWDYELTDVNQLVTIELPADCPAGMVDAPLLPDASDVLSMPGILTYGTSSSPADAAAFYQEQVPGLGWELLGEPSISDTAALLDFTKGDQMITIFITAGDSATTIRIIIVRTQE